MKKVLLADADPINIEVLGAALMGEGYRITSAGTLDQWNRIVHEKSFHLILMDESFLSISKHLFSLSKEAFQPFEKTPLIVMTEYPELAEYGYKFPKRAKFLLKPFQAGEMFSLIRQIFFEESVAVA